VSAEAVIGSLVSGLSTGMVFFLAAAGLSVIFGTLDIINLAHGSFYMLGTFFCFQLTMWLGSLPGFYWWSVLLAPIGVAVVGSLIEMIFLRRIYDTHMLYQLILTFALILIIEELCKFIWGVGYHNISVPWPLAGSIAIGKIRFAVYNLFLIGFGVAMFVGLQGLFHYTGLGKTIRAVTFHKEMAGALGVNVPLVYTGVFMLGCWLAGLAGVLMAPMTVVKLGADLDVLLNCFIVVVIGGLGSLSGAFIGAIILGLVTSFGIAILPGMAIVFGFMLMAIILIIRPYGLMGKRSEQ